MMNVIIALLCSLLSAGVTIGGKMFTVALPAFAFAFLRYGLASFFLLPLFIINKEKEAVKLHDLPVFMFLGFTLVFLFNALFFNALYYSSATSVTLIGATNPILTMLVSAVVFRQVPNKYQALAFLLSFVGAVLVITEGEMALEKLGGNIGELLMLLAVLCQITYGMVLKKVSAHFSPLTLSFATLTTGILCVLPFVANREFVSIVTNLTLWQWGMFVCISGLGTALDIYLYSLAIKRMGPAQTSLIIFSSMPIFVFLLAFLILGEGISAWQLLGGILVVSSLVVGLRHTR